MHHFMCSLPKWVLRPQKEISSCVLNMTIFKKFFEAFMRHITRWNAGKEIKWFTELFINKTFEYTFVTFEYEQTIAHCVIYIQKLCVLLPYRGPLIYCSSFRSWQLMHINSVNYFQINAWSFELYFFDLKG